MLTYLPHLPLMGRKPKASTFQENVLTGRHQGNIFLYTFCHHSNNKKKKIKEIRQLYLVRGNVLKKGPVFQRQPIHFTLKSHAQKKVKVMGITVQDYFFHVFYLPDGGTGLIKHKKSQRANRTEVSQRMDSSQQTQRKTKVSKAKKCVRVW